MVPEMENAGGKLRLGRGPGSCQVGLWALPQLPTVPFYMTVVPHAALDSWSPEAVEAIFPRLCAYHQSQGVHLVEGLQQIFPDFCRLLCQSTPAGTQRARTLVCR